MSDYVVLKSAGTRINNIYMTTLSRWGAQQAKKYIEGLFQHFEGIAHDEVVLKLIPAEFKVDGFISQYEKHFVYSKKLQSGKMGIVTVLHQRMHQIERFSEDFRS